jgi:hypothetical protein
MPLYPDILNEDCSDISDWTDIDSVNGVSSVSPSGQFQFNASTHASGNYAALSRILVSPPNTFTLEIKMYFDTLGTTSNSDQAVLYYYNTNWQLRILFGSNGLFVVLAGGSAGEVGTDIVKCNATVAWQTWRFQINKTTPSSATCEVFLKEEGGAFVSQGTVDCDYETGGTDGLLMFKQFGVSTDNMISHVDYIKIATGLGEIYGDSTSDFLQLF